MKKFDDWWHSIYIDKPKEIHRQCYEEGYEQGRDEVKAAVMFGGSALLVVLLIVLLVR
jgi:hypothetical protein